MYLKRAMVTVGATVGAGATIGMFAAGAAQAHVITRTPSVVAAAGLHPFAATAGDGNPYQAGYAAPTTSSGTLSLTIKVPKLTCKAKDTADALVTVFLYGANPDGSGIAESGGQILLNCQNGDTLDNVSDNSGDSGDGTVVHAGDVVQFSDAVSTAGETLTYTDETTGATATDGGEGFSTEGTLILGQGVYNSTTTPQQIFPEFSPMKFTSVMVDGTALGSIGGVSEYYQESPAGKKQITCSAITKTTDFTDTFVSG